LREAGEQDPATAEVAAPGEQGWWRPYRKRMQKQYLPEIYNPATLQQYRSVTLISVAMPF
jgi:hypothetical protein